MTEIGRQLAERARSWAQRIATADRRSWKLPFELARELQGIPGAIDAVRDDEEILRPAVEVACQTLYAAGYVADEFDVSPAGRGATFIAVVVAWTQVKNPGPDRLTIACEKAKHSPICFRHPLDRAGPHFNLVMSVAYYLQVAVGADTPIQLPVERLSEWLGIARTRLTPLLAHAKRRNILRLERSHSFTKHEAADYLFDVKHPLLVVPDSREPGEDDDCPKAAADVGTRSSTPAMGRAP